MYVCSSCGTKFTPEEARKLLVEVTVTRDNSEKIRNLLEAAQKARDAQNWNSAAVYYQDLFAEDPDNWEAAYFSVYAVAMECKIAQIASACSDVLNVLPTTLSLIIKSVSKDKRAEAVETVANYTVSLGTLMFNSALKHHMGIDGSVAHKFNNELRDRLNNAMLLLLKCGEMIDSVFGNTDAGKYAVQPIVTGIGFIGRQAYVTVTPVHEYEEKLIGIVEKYDAFAAESLKERKTKAESFVLKSGIVLALLGAISTFCGFKVAEGGFWVPFLKWMGYFMMAWGALKVLLYVITMASRKKQ